MGRIIDRRRVMGGSLPYDAEIEYLESTGTQWIDTGIIPYRGFEATIDFQYTSLANNQSLFGCWNTNSRTIYMVCLYQSAWYFGSYSTSNQDHVQWKDNVIDMKRHTISIDGNGSISQDGVLLQTTSNMSNSNIGASVYVFARNLRIGMTYSRIRCYSFKMKDNNNTLILDLIPVRIGQTGYMYDKVSKQLFGNAGTGEFILGPDKHKEFVDLGLPSGTLWAEGNIIKNNQGNYSIGKPTDKGCYFSWGNIDGHNEGEEYNFSQDVYNTTPGATLTGNILPTDAEHDAAVARIGEWCHIPTKDQFVELCNSEYTDIIGTSRDGIEGLLITSRINGNSIFLPDAGLYNGTSLYANGTYWSSTFSNEATAYYLFFFSGTTSPTNTVYRCWGLTVRAVISR